MIDDMFLISGGEGDGGGEKKPAKKTTTAATAYNLDDEFKNSYKKVIPFDNKPAVDIVKSAAQKVGVDPSLLFSSAYQEGMNKAIWKPNDVSEAFINAEKKGLDTKNFPIDGFYNYGLDTFSDKYQKLKKYLPAGFETEFKPFKAFNEKKQAITTAAFKSNEAALIAKAAMLKDAADEVASVAKSKGVEIAPEDKDYFTLARYNTSLENVKNMVS